MAGKGLVGVQILDVWQVKGLRANFADLWANKRVSPETMGVVLASQIGFRLVLAPYVLSPLTRISPRAPLPEARGAQCLTH